MRALARFTRVAKIHHNSRKKRNRIAAAKTLKKKSSGDTYSESVGLETRHRATEEISRWETRIRPKKGKTKGKRQGRCFATVAHCSLSGACARSKATETFRITYRAPKKMKNEQQARPNISRQTSFVWVDLRKFFSCSDEVVCCPIRSA